jgi:hypothetical protein
MLARCHRRAHTPGMTDTDDNLRGETLLGSADLSPELIAALDRAVATQAERDPASRASRSQLIARIVAEWLHTEGHLRHSGQDEGVRPQDLTSENDR